MNLQEILELKEKSLLVVLKGDDKYFTSGDTISVYPEQKAVTSQLESGELEFEQLNYESDAEFDFAHANLKRTTEEFNNLIRNLETFEVNNGREEGDEDTGREAE